MPIRAVLFDLGNTLVSYYQPTDFMPILRRSLEACLLTLGHTPLGREAQTELVHQALELNQERADLAVWPLEERTARIVQPLRARAIDRLRIGRAPVRGVPPADFCYGMREQGCLTFAHGTEAQGREDGHCVQYPLGQLRKHLAHGIGPSRIARCRRRNRVLQGCRLAQAAPQPVSPGAGNTRSCCERRSFRRRRPRVGYRGCGRCGTSARSCWVCARDSACQRG